MSTQRELKFRALYHSIMPDGPQVEPKWAYGNLSYADDRMVQIFDQQETGSVFNCFPGTQGQYTELKDASGKDIYEGDVIQHCDNEKVVLAVEWSQEDAGWSAMRRAGGLSGVMLNEGYANDCRIIGNIHEHPHLLIPA